MADSTTLSVFVRVFDDGLKQLGSHFKSAGDEAERSQSHLGKFGSVLGTVGKAGVLAAGAAGIGALTYGLKVGIGEWTQSQKVAAQTAAVLKSTGGAAGVTAKQIDALATSLMKKSGMDDEAIKSGENLLLTFTNIKNQAGAGNDIFTQTTKIMTDMSFALGQDTKSSAIQLGKALNDPIKGVTALQRVGVSFTKSQKDQIKALVESGHTLDAQKLILRELTKEFGGSAEAAGKTLPGQINILKESFNNFAGDMVGKMIPVLQRTIAYLRDHWPEIKAAIESFWNSVKPILENLGKLIGAAWPIAQKAIEAFLPVLKAAAQVISDVVALVAALLSGDWSRAWELAKKVVIDELNLIWTQLQATFTLIQGLVTTVFGVVQSVITTAWNAIQSLTNTVWNGINTLLTGIWNGLKTLADTVWNGINTLITSVWNGLNTLANTVWNAIKTLITGVWTTLQTLSTTTWNTIKTTVEGVWNALHTTATTVWNGIKTAIMTPINLAKTTVDTAVHGIQNVINSVFGAVSGTVSREWNGIKTAITGAINTAKSVVTTATNGIKTAINDTFKAFSAVPGKLRELIVNPINHVIDLINGIRIPGFSIHINLPDPIPDINFGWDGMNPFHIPHLASGGIVTAPTLALLGESGPEAVLPLNRSGGGLAPVINIHVAGSVVTEKQLVDVVHDGLLVKKQRGPLGF